MHFAWETLTSGVHRCRLPFCDVTVGLVRGRSGALLVDTGTTPAEAAAIDGDVRLLAGRPVSHIVLTHKHFDHVLGSSLFGEAAIYCAPEVVGDLTSATDQIRADALRHGASDLVVVAPAPGAGEREVVFTGDLVEESADPAIDADSDVAAWPATLDRLLAVGGPDAIYVPGHGKIVDAVFVRRQRDWLGGRAAQR